MWRWSKDRPPAAHMGRPGAVPLFPESPERDFSILEKQEKRRFFVLLFAACPKPPQKKSPRAFLRYFLRRAKSNQKHAEGFGPLDSGERFKIPSVGIIYWVASCVPIRKSLRKITVLCNIARSILNRCEGVILLRKDFQFFIKRQALIWVDSSLCVSWKGGVW